MREEYREVEETFYAECARILDVPHSYRNWTGRGPNRWNNRAPGNGRFPGRGTIRMFSPTAIHVSLTSPSPVNRFCRSPQEVYDLLATLPCATVA